MIRKLLQIGLTILMLAGLWPLNSLAAQGELGQDKLDRIYQYVARQLAINNVVGGSYAIVHEGEVIDAWGIGVVDRDSGVPVTPETVYAVASVTKSLTATAVLKLYEQGLIELDAPVQAYIPWFTYQDQERSARVTIRHLLTHAAGIHRFEADGSVFQNERENRNSLERTVRALATVSMTDEPGSKGAYCNSCYNVLGLVIEKVTGMDYEQYMEHAIFEPLHMDRTSFDPDAYPEMTATEYHWMFGWKRPSASNLEVFGEGQNPEGGIYSNVLDLSKYLAAMLGDGEYPLLAQETLAMSHKGEVEADEGFRYAVSGFEEGMLGSERVLYKAGDGIGSGAMIVLLPERKLGISLLIGESIPELGPPLAMNIARMLLGETPEDIKVGLTFWKLVGWVSLGFAAIGLLLVLGLVRSILSLRRDRRRASGLIVCRAVVCLVISLPIAYLLIAVRPTQIGFYGYPYDLAVGLIAMMASTALWAIYSMIQLVTRR
jgi:CubicO group peptidase (beta-lactamase class C family)